MTTETRVETRAGVGFSENPGSREAGVEAARTAMAQSGNGGCDLALLFATSKHDPAALRDGVRSVIGESARLVGGSAVGVITGERMGYEGHQAGVAVISSESMDVDVFVERGLDANEASVGRALGGRIREASFEGEPNLLLLYDIVKRRVPEGLSLNMATPLLSGLTEALGAWPHTAGGGLVGDMQWNPTFQFVDGEIVDQSAIGLVLSGGVRMDTIILHGCKPSGRYMTITKADRNVVLELDGRPTLEVVAEWLGPDTDRSTWEDYPLYITLGINKGDKFGEYREDDYAVRLCMDVDRERGGLAFFGDDLQAGTEVQLMRRSIDFAYIGRRAEELRSRLAGRKPFLAVYIDCAGRAAAYCGTDREEAQEVQRAIGDEIPLIGWYVGCEIARAGDAMESHNWTGVLSILSE